MPRARAAGGYSYRTLLLATCLGLALGAGALFAVISWRVQRRTARELEDTRVQLALLQVNRRIQVLLSQAIELNAFARQQVNPDRVTAADFDDLAARFLPVLRQSGDVNYIGAALAATGESFFLRRTPGDSVSLRQCILVAGRPTYFVHEAAPGQPLRRLSSRSIESCDARDRPFYTAPVAAGRAVWTASYEFLGDSTGLRRGVSFSTPLFTRDGRIAAVVESDIETRTLSEFLARLQDRFQGEVFVLEERADGTRRVLAHPRPAVLLDSTGRRALDDARQITDPAVRGILALLDKPFRELTDRTDRPLRFGEGRTRFAGAFTLPVGRDRPTWLVAVTLPETVALADLRRSQRNALLILLGLAVLTVIVAVWLSGRLSTPIEQLVREAKEINGERLILSPPERGPDEVIRLAQVYEDLLARARSHRDELARLNLDLRASNDALTLEIEARRTAMARTEALEQQLLQSQKFEAMGTMAGGIAHDFNNILTAILGNAEMLEMDLPRETREAKSVGSIRAAAERARDLVKRILAFSRREKPERRRVRVGDLVQEAVALLSAGVPRRVGIVTELPGEGDMVLADSAQLVQVLLNLGTNAVYAMGEKGGELRISVVVKEAYETSPLPVGLAAGRHVEIIVTDTGGGIPVEALGRIFDPFYTTKPQGEGTGLGLSIVYGVIQAHGGAVTVNSRPEAGTEFHIYLPSAGPALAGRVA